MRGLKILDCTLRDGGYINQWSFGIKTIKHILKNLESAKIDIIECGYLNDKKNHDLDKSLYNSVDEIKDVIGEHKKEHCMYVAMINYGDFSIESLTSYDKKSIDGIRIAFHKKDVEGAIELSKGIVRKGYKVFFQPMVTLSYSDMELLKLIHRCNDLDIYAYYIVDSFGSMRAKDLIRIAYLVNENLNKDIVLGFHSHNNLQLAYSNAIELLRFASTRQLIIDTSVFGMGRGAGNLNTELFAEYLNLNHVSNYEIEPLLEIIDLELNKIYKENYWGYSIAHYLSAVNGCHPNYATYFVDKNTLPVKSINTLLSKIDDNNRLNFNAKYAEELYVQFNENVVEDKDLYDYLKNKFRDKNLLIMAPGKSIKENVSMLKEKIKDENTVSVWINYYSQELPSDIVFLNNLKRLDTINDKLQHNQEVIVTSNIQNSIQFEKALVIDYKNLTIETAGISDNATLMFFNLLIKLGEKKVEVAGFDGFSTDESESYLDEKMAYGVGNKELKKRNELIKQQITEIKKYIDIHFLTHSLYQ